MKNASRIARQVARTVTKNAPGLHGALVELDTQKERVRHSLARHFPALIRPKLKKLTIAVTAHCNLRCVGCRYGRDYMSGSSLDKGTVCRALEDGRAGGAEIVRLYGGEPLLHPDLPAMVKHAVKLGYVTYVTTNGMLLDQRIDELFEAGLRDITIGFYGIGDRYDEYVQRENRYARIIDNLTETRKRFGPELRIQLNYLVMRPTIGLDTLEQAWDLCERFNMTLHTDLIHYSLPYFMSGMDHELQFTPADREAVQAFTDRIRRLKRQHPHRIPEPEMSLASIPDWLYKGPEMRIPCDAYRMVWIGADGSVRLCYASFPLGNLNEQSLGKMLGGSIHRKAARGAFVLNCPNCHCERATRIAKHGPSRRAYGC